MGKMSFFLRFFLSLFAVIATAIAIPAYYFSGNLEKRLLQTTEDYAFEKLQLISLYFDFNSEDPIQESSYQNFDNILTKQSLRLSLINSKGKVIYDTGLNAEDTKNMDNHSDRIEIKQAQKNQKGISIRHSNTLSIDFIYVAELFENGYVLRLALPYTKYITEKSNINNSIITICFIGLIISILLAVWFSYIIKNQLEKMLNVVESISLGKFKSRLHHVPWQEFSVLANAVNRMAENIERQLEIGKLQSLQLEVIFDTMKDAILLLDSQGFVRHTNKALRTLCPFMTDNDAIPSEQKIPVIECIASPMLQNTVDTMLQLNDFKNNDEPCDGVCYLEVELFAGRHFAMSLAKPENPSESMGLVIVLHEITDLVRLETVRKDFVANVSHELRTPLTAIQGYAETIENMSELPAESRRFAQIIHKHGSYLNTMIEDLLSLARIENNNENFMLSQVSPLEALNTAIVFCNKLISQNNLSFKIDIDSNIMVLAEKVYLERVFRNLLENACRYALPDSEISISATVQANYCVFTVENKGVYISSEHIDRIFERFYRVEKDRATVNGNNGHGSTGLGLAICKHIIEKHGGTIKAMSELHNGYGITSFIFTLFMAKTS